MMGDMDTLDPLSLDADWDMEMDVAPVPKLEPTRPWHVIMDFDGTITTKDTIDALVCQTILYNYEEVIDGGGRFLELEEVKDTEQGRAWEECKRRYGDDLDAFRGGMSYYQPGTLAVPRENSEEEAQKGGYVCTYQDEIEILECVRPIEEFSIERVNRTGIFDHVGGNAVLKKRAMQSERHLTPAEIAKNKKFPQYGVSIRDGFSDFTDELKKRPGATWGVVSVNWSKDWIQGIILLSLGREVTDEGISIISNSPVAPDTTDTTDKIDETDEKKKQRGIQGLRPSLDPYSNEPTLILTTEDKLKAMNAMLREFTSRPTSRGPRPQNIYIGDSTTDFSCLLRADVGIIMCDEAAGDHLEPRNNVMVKMLHDCGFLTRHVRDHEMLHRRVDDDETSPYVSLLWARSFEEILESGMLSNGNWKFDMGRKSMNSAAHVRNIMGKN